MPEHTNIGDQGVNLGISKHARWITCHKPTKSPSRYNPPLWKRTKGKNRNNGSKNSHWHKWITTKGKVSIHFISNNKSFELFSSFCNLNPIYKQTRHYIRSKSWSFGGIHCKMLQLESKHLTANLFQMLVRVYIAARIPRIYNNQCNSVLICKGFDSIKINLPAFLWEKIKMPNFKMPKSCTKFINWEAWPWKQDICTRASKHRQSNINSLSATGCYKNIIRC